MGEGPPVTEHPIGQPRLGRLERQIGYGGGVKQEGKFGAVTDAVIAERDPRPHAVV